MSIDVLSLFQKLNNEGITIVLVTHEKDLAKFANRIIELRDGKIIRDFMLERKLIAEEELDKLKKEIVE